MTQTSSPFLDRDNVYRGLRGALQYGRNSFVLRLLLPLPPSLLVSLVTFWYSKECETILVTFREVSNSPGTV